MNRSDWYLLTRFALSDTHLYLAAAERGLRVVQALPANPQTVSHLETSDPHDVALSAEYAYLATDSGLEIIDTSDQQNPQRIGSLSTDEWSPGRVVVSGERLYVGERSGNHLLIFDLDDPAQPNKLGSYRAKERIGNLVLSGDTGYISHRSALEIIDLHDSTAPQTLGEYQLLGGGYWENHGLAVSGKHVYVEDYDESEREGWLLILDASDPATPTKLGQFPFKDIYAVAVSGQHAYVVDYDYTATQGWHTLHILDVSDPTTPSQVGLLDTGQFTSGYTSGLLIAGDYAYLGDDSGFLRTGGMLIVNVNDPTTPRKVGGNNRFIVDALAMRNGVLYIASANQGLAIMETAPFFSSIAREAGGLRLSWEGFGRAVLQRATSLTAPDWQTLPGSESMSELSMPLWSGSEFFRLAKPD